MTMPMDWGIDREHDSKIIYYDLPRYFKVGCDHEPDELNAKEAAAEGIMHGGRCYHITKCKRCGMTDAYDSSD